MKTHIKFFLITSLITLFSFISFASEEHALIQKQFVEFASAYSRVEIDAKESLKSINPDGTWPDVDYTSRERGGGWSQRKHLQRMQAMSVAYANPSSEYFCDDKMKTAILSALGHWLKADYQNPNWWWPCIGIPRCLVSVFILLGDDLPEDMLKQAEPILKRSKMGMTGQNKVWCAGIAFYKGYLYGDASLMQKAVDQINSEVHISQKEGLQADWTFHQHGPQLQTGNYGLHFAEDMVEWVTVLKGTQYAISADKLELLRNYLLESCSWMVWKGRLDQSGCGRQIDAGKPLNKGQRFLKLFDLMAKVDPAKAKEYHRHKTMENNLVGHKAYWRSNISVHRRLDWYASVKMSSKRVIGTETCNSENLRGLLAGDGVLLLYQSGLEYDDIAPLWNWHRLPGTTCDQGIKSLVPSGKNVNYSNSGFCGNLSCGETGMAAMLYKRAKLSACKAWFFEKDSIICLGSGITGESIGSVYTSIQQSLLHGPVVTSKGNLAAGEHKLAKGSWLHHDGVGYHLLNGSIVKQEKVNGNWKSIYSTRGDRPATGDIFSLWIDHAKSPKNQSYAYTIYPQAKPSDMAALTEKPSVRILANTDNLQAIENESGVKAVFYNPGKLTTHSKTIEVSAPCLLSVTSTQLTLSDPLCIQKSVTVTIDGKSQTVVLPQADSKGKQVSVSL